MKSLKSTVVARLMQHTTPNTDAFCIECYRRTNIRNYINNTVVCIFNAQRILKGWYIPKSIRYAMAQRTIRVIREFLFDGVLAEGFGIIPDAMDVACDSIVTQMDKDFISHWDYESIPFETLKNLLMQFLQFSYDYLVPYLNEMEQVYRMEMSGGY